MKAETIYKLASAILFEKPGADQLFQTFFPSLLNLLLQEALPYENAAREAAGGQPLPQAASIETLEDDVPYCDALCALALPYGVAAYYFQDETDDYKSQDFRARYLTALRDAAPCVFSPVEDCYGGTAACRR